MDIREIVQSLYDNWNKKDKEAYRILCHPRR